MAALVISLGVLAYGYDSAFIGIVHCACAHVRVGMLIFLVCS
jgi:hypothetical protein